MSVKRLEALFTANASQAIGEVERLAGTVDTKAASMGEKFASFGKAVTMATVVVGAAVVGMSVKLADEFEKSDANLRTALKNQNLSWDANKTAISAAVAQGAKYGQNATEIEQALARGVAATGSVTKATKELKIAQDLAAFTHKDLATAMLAVIRGGEGQIRPIKQLGVDLPIAASGALQLAKAHENVTKATEALALVEAHHAEGRLKGVPYTDALTKANENLKAAQEKVNTVASGGDEILKALTKTAGGAAAAAANTFGGEVKATTAQLENLGIRIGLAVMPVLKDLLGALMDGVKWLGNHKTAAEGLAIVVGTVLVAAIATYIYNLVAAGVMTVITAGKAVIAFGEWAIGAVTSFATATGAAEGAEVAMGTSFAAMSLGALGVVGAIVGIGIALNNLSGQDYSSGDISSLMQEGRAHMIKSGMGGGGWGGRWGFGAEGAIVSGPTLAMIGEAGPEAVVPLNRMPGASPLSAMGGGGGTIYNLTVNAGPASDRAALGQELILLIQEAERRTGPSWRKSIVPG